DSLKQTLATVSTDGAKFSRAVDQLEQLTTGLAVDRDPIGDAITALDEGTASLASLLTEARPPLSGTVDQLTRLAPMLSNETDLAR
ncbi:mammalian cell entry protein, partial [Mycobacterium sp. ITM-2017-0098]